MKLRVYHIPQVPMKSFTVEVKDIQEAIKILEVLENYDDFQFKNNIKPDYSNANGLEIFNKKCGEWEEYYDEQDRDIGEIRSQSEVKE